MPFEREIAIEEEKAFKNEIIEILRSLNMRIDKIESSLYRAGLGR